MLDLVMVKEKVLEALKNSGELDRLLDTHPMLTSNSLSVLERRYQARDREGNVIEEPNDMFHRVAHNLAQADKRYGATDFSVASTEEEFYKVMRSLDYLPNSPTLMNAGRSLQMLSACFVLPVNDSMEDIFETVKEATLVQKSGGGTGFSFSRLRPEGDIVGSTGGVASGPVSFMKAFDGATEAVKQGSTRRGANMGILNVDHPDILKFISAKEDGKSITNFNISVAVTEEWMEKVIASEDYPLINPRNGKVTGYANAREVFDLLVEMAWKTGDPGIVFLDRINMDNPTPSLGEIESTNPCITGDTLVYTSNGLWRVEDLFNSESDVDVVIDGRFNEGNFQKAVRVVKTGVKQVFRLITHEGYEVRLTEDHRVMTSNGWIPASELKDGDKIHLLNQGGGFGTGGSLELGRLFGWLVGDGYLKKDRAVLSFFGSEKELAPKFAQMMDNVVPDPVGKRSNYDIGVVSVADRDEARVSSSRFLELANQNGIFAGNKHVVPESVLRGCREMQVGFLQGLFSADGHVSDGLDRGLTVCLTSISKSMLQDVQRVLLNFNIASKLYLERRKAGKRLLPNGKGGNSLYNTKAYHELRISKENTVRFFNDIGFLVKAKQIKLSNRLDKYINGPKKESFVVRFKELISDGTEMVYDITESVTNSLISNGIVVHNCGEQPLLPYESCNLGSINLSRMVSYSEENDCLDIDWDRLEYTVKIAVHMLDNVIDMNSYPIPQIDDMSKKTRRIGLGVMGFADLLVYLGIPYDSDGAVIFGGNIMKFIREKSIEASVGLAVDRGVFPVWSDSIYSDILALRNSALTTIAPTGTISIIAGCSSGIEPLFALSYVRNVMDNTRLVECNPVFEAIAHNEGFYSKELMDDLSVSGSVRNLDNVPDWVKSLFTVSHDIVPSWHVRMQSAFQNHVDNAVSKTINFSTDSTVEDVASAYMLAYSLGCKGITIYRDGSKENQVLSTGEIKDKKSLSPRDRPRRISGTTERINTGHGNMYVTINVDENGDPFEVFTTLGKAGGCDSAQLEAISRLISLTLRSGIDLDVVISQLQGITCCPAWDNGVSVRSAPDAVAIALKRYNNEESSKPDGLTHGFCVECANYSLVFQEGCLLCSFCGWSKCS